MPAAESRHILPRPGVDESTSHGPPGGSPLFGPDGGRILDVTEYYDQGQHLVRLLMEGLDEPTDTTDVIMPYKDYSDLLRSQPTSKSAYE